MAFVKVLKNKAFFKRYQVQRRRRREGKTDFQARQRMIRQDKYKYNNKKYRLIVRFTNKKVICQVAYATIRGDMIVAQASSTNLKKYGVSVGLKNYASAYCTGLLAARRTLKHFGLDDKFLGATEVTGEEYHVEDEDSDQRPFKCILDVGIRNTVVGARMWGALKGAVDGGLHIPHTTKNFPGYKPPEERGGEAEYEAEVHKDRIFGAHVKEYMESLSEEDPTKYEAHFAKFIEADVDADGMEEMYSKAHAAIREDPDHDPAEKKDITYTRAGNKANASDGTDHTRSIKLSLKQRQQKVQAKIAAAQAKMMVED
eukprot:CAMPEP_0179232984 /NCGR_PEP_ID=MMETSP0797-20121207/12138_1 /TAXON_ID=47934 /ORGANISM="Dinophysis acuminata, Strain DAEP01" /LENGTH=313 /DNA_ID=CAMNT_0020940115 /DNA_START=59 /DNA_END=1000 /DNA_ORIENTATION=+